MRFNGFHHIGLAVADAEKSLAFYKGLGGVETFSFPMGDTGKTIYLVDMGGNAVVEIIPNLSADSPEQSTPRWMHIALNTDDCQGAYDLALKLGAKAKNPPAEHMLGTMKIINAFVFGPDGEDVEFFTVL